MRFVLVHGGGFDARCWDEMIPALRADAIAVDLPGRGRHPADLDSVTLDGWAHSVVVDIAEVDEVDESNPPDLILVGHSMAGLTLPRVVNLIPERIRHVVFVSCSVPAHGRTMLDVLSAHFDRQISTRAGEAGTQAENQSATMSADLAVAMFCNDMTPAQTETTLSLMVPEAAGPLTEPADNSGLAHPIPRSWVRLSRDAIVSPATQDRFIATVGDLDVIDLDAGHMAMLSRPDELAAILNRIADL